MKCYECGKEETLPFTCSYCNQQFCIEHRLPENHLCLQSPKRKPLGSTLNHKDPYSLTKPRRKSILKSLGMGNTKRNSKYKRRKRLKRAVKIIASLVIIALLGYFIWTERLFIMQASQEVIEMVFPHNTDDEIETYIFQLINIERINRNLPALKNDTNLITIAKAWCNQIAKTKNLEHGDFTSRLRNSGIYTYGYQYGEIIESYSSTAGASSSLARTFVDGWLDSQGHREIMLTDLNGYMGVGVSRSESTLYGVVDFKFNTS